MCPSDSSGRVGSTCGATDAPALAGESATSGLLAASLICLAALYGTPVVGEVPDGVEVPLGEDVGGRLLYRHVKTYGQEETLWCWATAVQMINDYMTGYRESPTRQCEVVNRRVKGIDCCDPEELKQPASRARCVKGRWPNWKDLRGFTETRRACNDAMDDANIPDEDWALEEACALEWHELKDALKRGPVAFSWRWPPNGESGHMMVATGYIEFPNGEQWVVVNDPWPPSSGKTDEEGGEVMLVPYERYLYGTYTHWRDYYVKP